MYIIDAKVKLFKAPPSSAADATMDRCGQAPIKIGTND